MATRTAYDATASSVLTATNLDKHAGGWIGYVEVTGNQGSITTVVDLTGLTLTVTANASRYHRITSKHEVSSSTTGDVISMLITDGSNVQKNRATAVAPAGGAAASLHAMGVETGWSGTTTRKLRIQREAGSGTVTAAAGATYPAFLLIEDIGSA